MKIWQRIKKLRKELGLSVDDLATLLEKNRATIYRYENGDIERMPLDILLPIANALNTTPQYLMGLEDTTKHVNIEISDIITRLQADNEYLKVCTLLSSATPEQLSSIGQMLSVFIK